MSRSTRDGRASGQGSRRRLSLHDLGQDADEALEIVERSAQEAHQFSDRALGVARHVEGDLYQVEVTARSGVRVVHERRLSQVSASGTTLRSKSRSFASNAEDRLETGLAGIEHGAQYGERFTQGADTFVSRLEGDVDKVGKAAMLGRRFIREAQEEFDAQAPFSQNSKPAPPMHRSAEPIPRRSASISGIDDFLDLEDFRAAIRENRVLLDDVSTKIDDLKRFRLKYTGVGYEEHNSATASTKDDSHAPKPFKSERQARYAKLISALADDIEACHYEHRGIVRQLSLGFSEAIDSTTSFELRKAIASLTRILSEAIDQIEALAREEQEQMKGGTTRKCFLDRLARDEPSLDIARRVDIFNKVQSQRASRSGTRLSKLDLSSWEAQWTLFNPFTEVNRVVQKIELYSHGFGSQDVQPDHKKGQPIKSSRRPLSTPQLEKAQVSEHELKKSRSRRRASIRSEPETTLLEHSLAPTIPGDDTDSDYSESPSELQEDQDQMARAKRAVFPLFVAFWVLIAALLMCWAIRKSMGAADPLGRIELGTIFGDDSWEDTDGIV